MQIGKFLLVLNEKDIKWGYKDDKTIKNNKSGDDVKNNKTIKK